MIIYNNFLWLLIDYHYSGIRNRILYKTFYDNIEFEVLKIISINFKLGIIRSQLMWFYNSLSSFKYIHYILFGLKYNNLFLL